ncbi:MAG: CdaR family protein [Christensenella sp.]
MSKFVAIIKRMFVDNWKMKLIALIFAFILWSFVIAESNPPKTKIFKEIPVTYTAADEVKQKGLMSTMPLTELLKSVTVTAQANADALQYLNENMIQVSVDLSNITAAGEYTLPVKGTTTLSQGKIISVEPSTVTINVEEIISKDVPVDVQLAGERKEGLYYGEPVLESPTVLVTGSRTNVDKVAKAVCSIDISQMTEATTASYQVTYVDSNGASLQGNLFTGSASVIVEVPVYPKKDVPIDTAAIKTTAQGIADGYQITSVTVTPQTVSIVGEAAALEKITAATLGPLILENATGDTIVEAEVMLSEGVFAAVPAKVQVQLTITQPEIGKTYPAKKIAYKNLADGLNVQIEPQSVDVEVFGTAEAYTTFSASKLKPFVDLTGLGKGVHQNVPIKFENEPDLGVRPVPSSLTVTVTIT